MPDFAEAHGTLHFDPAASDDGRARASVRSNRVTVAGAAPIDEGALRRPLGRVG